MIPEGMEGNRISSTERDGRELLFLNRIKAWIQHSEKVKLTQNYKSRVLNLLCTEKTYILYIEERSSCHGGLGDEYGYHTEWQITALEGWEETASSELLIKV